MFDYNCDNLCKKYIFFLCLLGLELRIGLHWLGRKFETTLQEKERLRKKGVVQYSAKS